MVQNWLAPEIQNSALKQVCVSLEKDIILVLWGLEIAMFAVEPLKSVG